MAAIRREIKEAETQLESAQADLAKVNDQLRSVQQARMNAEEELVGQNTRLKQMLDELAMHKEAAKRPDVGQEDAKVTMAELSRKVDEALLDVLEAKFRDEAFATAIVEQSAATTGDKVRVEFEGDEVFWTMQENYTFEMLLQDAARYWDVSPNDAVLNDERGAIWPDDAYVALEMSSSPSVRIALRIKATAARDDDVELEYDDDEKSDEEEPEARRPPARPPAVPAAPARPHFRTHPATPHAATLPPLTHTHPHRRTSWRSPRRRRTRCCWRRRAARPRRSRLGRSSRCA